MREQMFPKICYGKLANMYASSPGMKKNWYSLIQKKKLKGIDVRT